MGRGERRGEGRERRVGRWGGKEKRVGGMVSVQDCRGQR